MQLFNREVVINCENYSTLAINYTDTHKDIIEQSKQGSIKAQYKLYKLYTKAMFNICYRLLNSHEEAQDLLQEAFSEAFIQLDSFRYESSFGAWLKKIVINRCINHLKKRRVDLIYYNDLHLLDKGEEEIITEDTKLTVAKIHRAISRLADGYRVIFTLYMLEGYDHTEIAQILNITESTSKSQYMRAKRKIKELVMQDEYNETRKMMML